MRKLKENGAEKETSALAAIGDHEDVAKKLVDAIDGAERSEKIRSARAFVFDSAHTPEEKPMPGLMRDSINFYLPERDETYDFAKERTFLENELRTTDRVGHQAKSLEEAEANARRAMILFLRYKQQRFEWEADNQVLFASMRQEATRSLQSEKDSGKRSKQITDADVLAECAHLFGDEFRAQEAKRHRAQLVEKALEHLVEMWGSKCFSLKSLVGKGR